MAAIAFECLGLRRRQHVPEPGRLEELAMHPTVKPVALVADAIKDCSHRYGLGSRSFLPAAARS